MSDVQHRNKTLITTDISINVPQNDGDKPLFKYDYEFEQEDDDEKINNITKIFNDNYGNLVDNVLDVLLIVKTMKRSGISFKGCCRNNAMVFVSTTDTNLYTLHHEMMHLIQDNLVDLKEWDEIEKSFIPYNCVEDDKNSDTESLNGFDFDFKFKRKKGFVSKYAMANKHEDISEIYAELITRNQCMNYGVAYDPVILKKMKYLIEEISKINDEWKQFIDNRLSTFNKFNFYEYITTMCDKTKVISSEYVTIVENNELSNVNAYHSIMTDLWYPIKYENTDDGTINIHFRNNRCAIYDTHKILTLFNSGQFGVINKNINHFFRLFI